MPCISRYLSEETILEAKLTPRYLNDSCGVETILTITPLADQDHVSCLQKTSEDSPNVVAVASAV
jgi:hypothetical protein